MPAIAATILTAPSAVAGRANVLVFPDLNAGSIGDIVATTALALALA